jgi:hypothetical protein
MLKVLKAGHNTLSGPLPDQLFNATALEYLSFPNNGLEGILDGGQIVNFRNLVHLDLGTQYDPTVVRSYYRFLPMGKIVI